MSNLNMPKLTAGMVVVTPTTFIYLLTPDKKYIIEDVKDKWVQIIDDSNTKRYYRSHLFIEADVYYNMILYLSLIHLFNISPNYLK